MTGPFAERLFRIAFALAGCYNLAFGLWAAVWPLAFFELFNIPPPRYPGIWACLGMVVGVYGLLYWHAARKLETAWPIIAVGLLGKVLGPVGMVMSFGDDWPRRLGMICVYNDLIWWLPFSLFLVRGTAPGRCLVKLAPWLCAIVHAAAFASIPVLLQPGLLTQPDAAARANYIAENPAAWTLGWSAWMLAAATLVGFYGWWAAQLAPRGLATLAVVMAALGAVCDFTGESSLILLLSDRAGSFPEGASAFTTIERSFTLLSAGAANALYTLGGLLLTVATPALPSSVRTAMWITWVAGIAMTIAAVMNHVPGMVASTVVLFPPLIGWTLWMAARWRSR
jgi:hypothetical protein